MSSVLHCANHTVNFADSPLKQLPERSHKCFRSKSERNELNLELGSSTASPNNIVNNNYYYSKSAEYIVNIIVWYLTYNSFMLRCQSICRPAYWFYWTFSQWYRPVSNTVNNQRFLREGTHIAKPFVAKGHRKSKQMLLKYPNEFSTIHVDCGHRCEEEIYLKYLSEVRTAVFKTSFLALSNWNQALKHL